MKLAYDTPETIRELFTEYTRMLVENEPAFQTYLDLQDYAAELADLTKKYGLPHGRLYIAWCDDRPVGCIGLRRLDDETCELKRLYVRPAYRGQRHRGADDAAHSVRRARHRLHRHAA
ncbi:MAG: GNAT family N-acetyltransferase [Oscillospiraceae bacterium]